MLKQHFPKGRVFAFEPNLHSLRILKERVVPSGVACVNFALGSRGGNLHDVMYTLTHLRVRTRAWTGKCSLTFTSQAGCRK
jgi:FkbM family methyltransferase